MMAIADLIGDHAADAEKLFEQSKETYINGDEDLRVRALTIRNIEQIVRNALSDAELESAVIDAAIKWRYQAHSQNKFDDVLWEAVDALIEVRKQ